GAAPAGRRIWRRKGALRAGLPPAGPAPGWPLVAGGCRRRDEKGHRRLRTTPADLVSQRRRRDARARDLRPGGCRAGRSGRRGRRRALRLALVSSPLMARSSEAPVLEFERPVVELERKIDELRQF